MSSASQVPRIEIAADGGGLVVTLPGRATVQAPAAWLFDNAEGAADPASGHRLYDIAELEAATCVSEARLDGEALVVRFAPGDAERRILLSTIAGADAPTDQRPELWLGGERLRQLPDIDFQAFLADDAALAEALGRVARWGLVILAGAGAEPFTLERAVARFGYIRETNYGRFFDVREEIAPTHLAYTSRGLAPHTDNPYRDPEPTLQLLHVMEAAAEGGESQFVDGFAHAAALRAESPERFLALTTTKVPFAYRDPSGDLYAALAPVIELDAEREVAAVRLNHRALGPLPLADGRAGAWYDAYLDFHRRVSAQATQFERKLAPGEIVLFDNRRLLHARAPYRGAGGRRWLQGCYADRDGLLARLRGLSETRDDG
jgi:gamma-butyrobetaine dioxygenase